MAFIGPFGDIKQYYLTSYDLIDQFVGSQLWAVGYDSYGTLGDNTTTNKSSPVQTIAGGTNWTSVKTRAHCAVALKTDGTLWCWGLNTSGQIGDNTTTNKSSPVQTIAGGTNWTYVGGGALHITAIKSDGTLWTWGLNSYGQLGDNTSISKSSPIQTIAGGTTWKMVNANGWHTAAIKTDGTLWMWGRDTYGQLGDNAITNQSSPVQTIAGGTNWSQVSCGYRHTAAIKTDGTLWCWGLNTSGQLGDNTAVNKSSPIQTIAGGTNWKHISCGVAHTAALKNDGTLWLWGNDTYGQLGDNTTVNKSSPIQTVASGTNWKQVTACPAHTVAIKTDGTLWTWGSNNQGRLGDGTINNKSSPAQTISGGTTWKAVTGGYNTFAVTFSELPTT